MRKLSILLVFLCLLVSCDNQISKVYKIQWINDDGTVLSIQEIKEGDTPKYEGKEPKKESTEQYDYEFSGWSPEIRSASSDTTYTAVYSEKQRYYEVKWIDGDGQVLKVDNLAYGSIPVYSGSAPQKTSDSESSYTFNGHWIPEIVSVTENTSYVADFDSSIREYTVTWVDYNGEVLLKDLNVPYGTQPSFSGDLPTREDSAKYYYSFSGWLPKTDIIESDTTFTAQYKGTIRNYRVTWLNGDNSELKVETLAYGEIPEYSGITPNKESTISHDFIFSGWSPYPRAVVSDVTFTPLFDSDARKYEITWIGVGNKVLSTVQVPYGQIPQYLGDTPIKSADAQSTYNFAGWSPTPVAVVDDAEYSAIFSDTTNTYTVRWLNYDRTELEVDYNVPYGSIPEYNKYNPQKPSTKQYYYVFDGWSPEITKVKGDIEYVAKFKEQLQTFTVTWKDSDGYVLEIDSNVPYNSRPEYNGEPPKKLSDGKNDYTFVGWDKELSPVTGSVTYTAVFNATPCKYTITWANYDGTILEIDNDVLYGVVPEYNGNTPKKSADPDCSYIFSSWSPSVAAVSGDMTYTAQFKKQFTIIWKDYNDVILATDVVSEGDMPQYTGLVPIREKDAQYTYSFNGWSPQITNAVANTTYVASYSGKLNAYTVLWRNWDGTLLERDGSCLYGTNPHYDGNAPTKDMSESTIYVFSGWLPEIGIVQSDIEYVAQFTSKARPYTLIWKNYDGTVLSTQENIPYAVSHEYAGDVPSHTGSTDLQYIFEGWDSSCDSELSTITYTAKYKAVTNPSHFGYKLNDDADGYVITSYDDAVLNVVVPDRIKDLPVVEIGSRAFENSLIKSISLPASITKIDDSAFCRSQLETVTLVNGLQYIGASAFENVSSLQSIVIPSTVTEIGEKAFKNCEKLSSVTLSDSITEIKAETFYGCPISTSLTIPEGVTLIGNRAFYSKGLTSASEEFAVRLPSSLVSIGDEAFCGVKCKSINLPEFLENIGKGAFAYTGSLSSIVIPKSVTTILDETFSHSYLYNGVLFEGETKSIGASAFAYCHFTNIILPESLESIGECAFYECSNLKKITIPSRVEEIPDSAFANSDLSLGVVLTNIKTIGDKAFYGCSFSEITIPSSVTSIGTDAFYTFELTDSKKGDEQIVRDASGTYVGVAVVSRTIYYNTKLVKIIVNRPKDSIPGASWGANPSDYTGYETKTLRRRDGDSIYTATYTYSETNVYGAKPEIIWSDT